MGTMWRGLLAPFNAPSEDGRRIISGGVRHRRLPIPLRWQREDSYGHDKSVVVGAVTEISIRPDGAYGVGELFDDVSPRRMKRLADDVAEVKELLSRGVVGPSVDLTDVEWMIVEAGSNEPLTDDDWLRMLTSDEPIDLEEAYVSCVIAAGTLVDIPAFAECRAFELLVPALTAAVRRSGWDDFPLADRDRPWNSPNAKRRLAEDAGLTGDNPDWGRYAEGFLYRNDDANPETKGAYGYPIVDVVDGQRMIIPRGVFAAAASLEGSRTQPTIPEQDQQSMREIITGLYDRMADEWDDPSVVAPWAISMEDLAREMNEGLSVRAYPAEAFTVPADAPPGLLNMTVTDDGRVYGDVATHDVCHVGIRSECFTAPVDTGDYDEFHRYPLMGENAELIMTGRLTYGAGQHTTTPGNDDHAAGDLSAAGAIAHHDGMETVAYVRAWENTATNSIRVAGVLAPDVTDAGRRALSRGRVSGDWRMIRGALRLVEVLTLARERPGYPLPAGRLADEGLVSLTAAGTIHGSRNVTARRKGPGRATERLAEEIADKVSEKLGSLTSQAPAPTAFEFHATDAGELAELVAARLSMAAGEPQAAAGGQGTDGPDTGGADAAAVIDAANGEIAAVLADEISDICAG